MGANANTLTLIKVLLLGLFCLIGSLTSADDSRANSLVIVISHSVLDGTYTLSCNPDGGTHPAASLACANLNQVTAGKDDYFGRIGEACYPRTKRSCLIVDGPEHAHVTGFWEGKSVNAYFDRTDCNRICRWKEVRELFRFAEIRE